MTYRINMQSPQSTTAVAAQSKSPDLPSLPPSPEGSGSPRIHEGMRKGAAEFSQILWPKELPPVPATPPAAVPGTPVANNNRTPWNKRSPYWKLASSLRKSSTLNSISTTTSTATATSTVTPTAGTPRTLAASATVSSTSHARDRKDSKTLGAWLRKSRDKSPQMTSTQKNSSLTTPKHVKIKRHMSTPKQVSGGTSVPGRFAFSPVAPLSDKSPLSPTRVLAPARPVEDSSSSDDVELKSRHAVFLGHLDAAPVASPAKRAATLVRTESSVRLLGYFREDDPIVVISAWGTVLGLARMELERWAKEKPISESQWMEIGNTASEFSHHLNQKKPDPAQLTISFIKFGRLLRKAATAENFEKSILLPAISKLYFDIKYMPERLPSGYRDLIYPATVKFAQAIVKLAARTESSAACKE